MGCGGSTLAASDSAAKDAASLSSNTGVDIFTEDIKSQVTTNGSHAKPLAAAKKGALQHISPQQEEQKHHIQQEEHLGHTVAVSRCPMAHGSVGAGPFPGYVHGGHPAICKEGCK